MVISPSVTTPPPPRPDGDLGLQVTVKIDGVLRTLWLSRRITLDGQIYETPKDIRLGFPVGQMVEQLLATATLNTPLPEVVKAAKIDRLEMRRSPDEETFGLEFVTQYDASRESTLRLKLIIVKTKTETTVDRKTTIETKAAFSLKLRLGDPLDPVEFDLTLNGDGLFARLEQSSTPKRFTLAPLGKILSPELGELMGAVEITPLEIAIGHDKASSSYVLAARLDGEVALSKLPFLGERLPENVDLSIRDLGLVWCSAHLSQDEAARKRFQQAFNKVELLDPLNNKDGTTLDPLLVGGLFKATLTVPSVENPIPLQLPFRSQRPAEPLPALEQTGGDRPPQNRSRQAGNPSPAPALTPPSAPEAGKQTTSVAITTGADPGSAKWFEVNKTIGPLSLRRLGLAYADQRVWFLFDTSLNAGAVALMVDGLGAGLNPFDLLGGRFRPAFTLRGLGLVIKGPMEITGAFLRDRISDPRGDYDEFAGVILVKTAAITISGMGSYADPPWGDPSLFAYAFLDKPIGGPPFFFVTGLALGIAINRNLDLPPIDQVSQFPLVRLALGDDLFPSPAERPQIRPTTDAELTRLLEVQQAMKPYTRPSNGQVALALGVRFTTFKLLNSFALLVASFGKPFKLDLLVSSRLQVPALPEEGAKNKSAKKKKSSAKEPLLAQVGIDLRGTWIPEEGFLIVEGRITEGSWFLDSACQLSGGAAFAAWSSGPHSGDFVMTVGGYHPKFQVPAHYPQVPRLAFNFTRGPIEIKGDAYFAMTPSALMTGGSLSATFAEGKFRAWFDCKADFLVAWEPFAYDATMFIEVGASYRTALGTIGASVGARLHLWGPDLAGVATVDLRVVKFDIRFGTSENKPPVPISAETFKERFLPADKKDLISIGVSDGLIRAGTDRDIPLFVVNPAEFTLAIESVIPQQDKAPLGIGPMGITAEAFGKTQVLQYEIHDISQSTPAPITNFIQTSITKPVPAALWGPADKLGEVRSLRYDTKDTVIPATVGYQLKPPPPPPPPEGALAKYSVSHFLFSSDTWEDTGRKNPTWPVNLASWKPDKTTQSSSSEQSEKVMTPQDRDAMVANPPRELFKALTGTPMTEQEISISPDWLDSLQEKPRLGTLSEVTP